MRTRRFVPSIPSLAACAALWLTVAVGSLTPPVLGQTMALKQGEPCPSGFFCITKGAELAVPLCPAGNIAYSVTVENQTTLPGGAEIFDQIPAGTTVVQGSWSNGAGYDAANDRIVWEGPLPPGQSWTIGFSVTVDQGIPSPSTISNVATGKLFGGENPLQVQTEPLDVQVNCPPLTVDVTKKRQLTDPLCPGSNIHYTVRITNHSTRNRLLDARIEDPVPANAEFAGSLTPNTRLENNTVVWEGKLGPGQSHEIGFSVRVPDAAPDGTPINNRATGRLEDPVVGDFAENVDEVVDVVDCPKGDLGFELEKKSTVEGPLCPGTQIQYEITITNTSAVEGLLDAEIVDPLPDHTTSVMKLTPPEATEADGEVTWEGKLAQGQSQTVTYEVTVAPAVPDGTPIVNIATALLREPVTGFAVTGNDRTEDTVECVKDVQEAQPAINLDIWLKYVEFKDDMDDGFFFIENDGDMFGLSAVKLEGDPAFEGTTGFGDGVQGNARAGEVLLLPVTDEPSTEDGKKIYSRSICCTDRDVELAVDFWDEDSGYGDLLDRLAKMADKIGEAHPDTNISAASKIGEVLADALRELGLTKEPDHLGFYGDKDLRTPWIAEPERFSCPLKDAVMDGDKMELQKNGLEQGNEDFLDRPHTLRLRQGGKDNGDIWLEWKGYPDFELQEDGPSCNKIRRSGGEGQGEGKIGRHPGSGRAAGNAERPTLRLLTFSTFQASERELDLAWTFELPAGESSLADVLADRGPVSLRGLLTTPRDSAAGTPPGEAQAWRVGIGLSLEAGSVVAEPTVSRWQGTEWVETGADALETSVADGLVRATFDHRDVGELATYSVSADVFERGAVSDTLPESPSREYLLAWKPDRMPPLVRSVRVLPSDVSEGPDGELLPRGSVDRIVVDLSERVELIPGDIRLEPSVDVDVTLEGRTLTVKPREVLGAGAYELVLSGGILDTGGNRLDGNRDGTPGDDFRHAFRVIGFKFFATDSRGARKTLFTSGEEIYASGSGFEASAQLRLYLMPAQVVSDGAALEDFTSDGPDHVTTGPGGNLDAVNVGSAPQPGEYSLIADVDGDGRFEAAFDRQWREPGIGVGVVDEGEEPEPPTVPEPPPGAWLTSPDLPGFEAKVRITPAGGEPVAGAAEPSCIVESLCVSGALPGRPEVFVKVIGPRPNGKLWTQISRFTPSEVEVWLRQIATGTIRYYRLGPVGSSSDDVSGLQDREAFDPAGAPSSAPRGVLMPGAAVDLVPASALFAPRLEPGEPEPPEAIDWLDTPELPGFRVKARIRPAGGSSLGGRGVARCVPETLCIAGALEGRPEVFAKLIGPRPNGFLWVQAARFTPSRVELWVEQTDTGTVRYYRLEPVGPGSDDVSGLQDREAFSP